MWDGIGLYSTVLTALSTLASKQTNFTQTTMYWLKQLLDCIAYWDPAVIHMVDSIHSHAGFLNKANDQSQANHHYLSKEIPFAPNNDC